METQILNGKEYKIDSLGFLIDHREWDENFAKAIAPSVGIDNSLTKIHWQVIHFIRDSFAKYGRCPLIYQTCRLNGLRLRELKELFPSGHLRGACKLAGLTYKEGYLNHYTLLPVDGEEAAVIRRDKTYKVDVRGFLADPDEWDEQFAIHKAYELKVPDGLTEDHWKIIYRLRSSYKNSGQVPTVYETCDANEIELEQLEKLFPDGYHRGAVKIAGLRVR